MNSSDTKEAELWRGGDRGGAGTEPAEAGNSRVH